MEGRTAGGELAKFVGKRNKERRVIHLWKRKGRGICVFEMGQGGKFYRFTSDKENH